MRFLRTGAIAAAFLVCSASSVQTELPGDSNHIPLDETGGASCDSHRLADKLAYREVFDIIWPAQNVSFFRVMGVHSLPDLQKELSDFLAERQAHFSKMLEDTPGNAAFLDAVCDMNLSGAGDADDDFKRLIVSGVINHWALFDNQETIDMFEVKIHQGIDNYKRRLILNGLGGQVHPMHRQPIRDDVLNDIIEKALAKNHNKIVMSVLLEALADTFDKGDGAGNKKYARVAEEYGANLYTYMMGDIQRTYNRKITIKPELTI